MGGGGAMRGSAAAGLGPHPAGVSGRLPENLAGHSAVRASASATRSPDDSIAAAIQARSALKWDLDHWEFDGYQLDKPRLVENATSDLKDALDMMYFSSSNAAVVSGSSSPTERHNKSSKSESSLFAVSGHSETSEIGDAIAESKISVISQAAVPAPSRALRAFQILGESPAAQRTVGSIASDPNAWDVVLQSGAVKETLQPDRMRVEFSPTDLFGDIVGPEEPGDAKKLGNFIMDIAESVKLAVGGWVNNLPGFFQDLFRGPGQKAKSGESGPSNLSPGSTVVSRSMIGLAVMVIMVASLKRG